jgi:hypothetical protein
MAPHVLVPLKGAAVSTVDDLASRAAVLESLAPAKRRRQSMYIPGRVGMAAPLRRRRHGYVRWWSRDSWACPAVSHAGGCCGPRQSRACTGRCSCGWHDTALADPFVFGEATLLPAPCASSRPNSGSFTFVSSSPLPGSRWVGQSVPTADQCPRIAGTCTPAGQPRFRR